MSGLPRLSDLLSSFFYRQPMMVRELMIFKGISRTDSYYVCPRCRITVEREFVRYCDRCGQCLDWRLHAQAKIVYPGRKKAGSGHKP